MLFARALLADKENENEKEKKNKSNPYSHGWNGWETNSIEDY